MEDGWKGFGPATVDIETRGDGTIVLEHKAPLRASDELLLDRLRHWAKVRPDHAYLAERKGEGWRRLNYGATLEAVDALSAKLLTHDLGPERPLLIISGNSIDHAIATLAGLNIGAPVAVMSPGAVQMPAQRVKLPDMLALLTPGLILADAPGLYREVLQAMNVSAPILDLSPFGAPSVWDKAPAAPAVLAEAMSSVGPETVAKLLFTSGSTGKPKAVINTHGMLASNMRALEAVWPFLLDEPPIMLDWLPWHHTFGGNCCFDLALHFGGAFHIDDGKPTPALVGRTIENLGSVAPNVYFNVPVGYDALLDHLEDDPDLARRFFDGLTFLFNAGAALPASTRHRLEAVIARTGKAEVRIIGGWGSTETAPFSSVVHFPTADAANLGLPAPGTSLKLTPDGGRLELRVKGPNVMPGYWRDPAATQAAFDEEGYYRTGDAGRLADADHPERGVVFDGRLAENFKLTSGTWVNVSAVRLAVIAQADALISDLVVTGHDRDEIGVMIFLNKEVCEGRLGAPPASGLDNWTVAVDRVRQALRQHNIAHSASSTRIACFKLVDEPPQNAHGEVTDKGYLNQRAILERRSAEVRALHGQGHRVDIIETPGAQPLAIIDGPWTHWLGRR